MSFTTRCPACGTTFKIVADQLKISEGWVRCGHCADVFDATLYLEPWLPGASASEPAGAKQPPVPSQPKAELTLSSAPDEDELITRPPALFPDEPPSKATEDIEFSTELQRFAAAKAASDPAPPAALATATISTIPIAKSSAKLSESHRDEFDEGAPVEAIPGFVRQAKRRAFWHSRGVRVGLYFLALLLGALLAAQWALHERDRLAALQPNLLPALQRVCASLGCTVGPMRNIESIVIDSSALVRRPGNFHSFDLVLKNTSSTALALPALELSLTDARDTVISRRVFPPEVWPDAPSVMPAQSSLNVSFRLSLPEGEASPMAGYRALVFYP